MNYKRCLVIYVISQIVLLLGFSAAFASNEEVNTPLIVKCDGDNSLLFESETYERHTEGKLCVSDPDKSIVYIGSTDKYEKGQYKRITLSKIKNGTYIAKIKYKYMSPKRTAFSIKEIKPVASGITNVVISTDDIPDGFDNSFKLEYDCTQLELLDGCALTYNKDLSPCNVSDTQIEIESVYNGGISFSVSRCPGQNISEVLNVVRFRQLKDTPSYVMIVTDLE